MDYNMIIDFFKNYGWQLTLLALSGIVVLGFLKWVGVFNHLDKKYKKYIYFSLSCLLSITACTIYLIVTGTFAWLSYLVLCLAVIGFTMAVYAIYENTGLRAVWKKVVLDNIAKLFKAITKAIVSGTLKEDKLKEMAIKLGSETLEQLVAEAKSIEEQKTAQANAEQIEQTVQQ